MTAVREFYISGPLSQRRGREPPDARGSHDIVQGLQNQEWGGSGIPPFARFRSCQNRCWAESVGPPPVEPWSGVVSCGKEGDAETIDPFLR